MRAAQISGYVKNVDEIKAVETSKPVCLPGCAVVRVLAAAANPIDVAVIQGHLKGAGWGMQFPFSLGYDFAGVIEEIDANSGTFQVGDGVFGMNWGRQRHDDGSFPIAGCFADFLLIPTSKLAMKPKELSFEDAGCLGVIGTTAYQDLFEIGQVSNHSRVLILGGSSSVGSVAVQLARNAGAFVATTCSSRTLSAVEKLNADHVVVYNLTAWENDPQLRDLDVIFDAVGDPNAFERADKAGVLKPGGKFISIADASVGYNPAAHPPYSYAAFTGVTVNPRYLEEVAKQVVAKKLTILVNATYPFTQEGVVEALKAVESGKSIGKNIIRMT